MNKHTFIRAGVSGTAGGIVMAMWSMAALLASCAGFWTPINLIAHTFWRGAPLDGSFSIGATILGLAVHMMMSAGLGVALAVAVRAVRIPTTGRSALAAVGMAFGLAVWLVMQYGVWPVIDATAAPLFTPWVFAVAHLIFGAVAGAGLAAPSRSRTPVHA